MRYGTWTGALALAATALTGCGGGGGDSDAGSAGISEGFWSAEDFGLLVTGTGEMWAIETDASPYVLYRGSVSTSGTQASGTFTGYQGASSFTGSVSGQVTARSRITGSATALGRTVSFTLDYDSSYDSAPSLAAIAGRYSASSGAVVTVAADGSFSGSEDGCALSGTLTPDSSGKNFYRVSMRFGAAPCLSPNGTATGVLARTGSSQLVGGVVFNGLGDAFVLTRYALN